MFLILVNESMKNLISKLEITRNKAGWTHQSCPLYDLQPLLYQSKTDQRE
jgi:hypothetical protein